MAKENKDTGVFACNWFVYHYEIMNDGRKILIFEPNVFLTLSDAETHCSVLKYLSGQLFFYCKEGEISKLDLILDDISDVSLPSSFTNGFSPFDF